MEKSRVNTRIFQRLIYCALNDFFDQNANPMGPYHSILEFIDPVFDKYSNNSSLFSAQHEGIDYADNSVPSLNDIHELVVLLDKYCDTERKFPHIALKDENLNDFSKIINLHDKIKTITPFLVVEYSPVPSSGEISLLSIYARLYKIITNNANWSNIILFFDETEITMHPELQRIIISELIKFFECFFAGKTLHLFFLTHSPILLSDIPKGNVCFLKKDKGKVSSSFFKNKEDENTFGDNIFELYKDSFFMEKGTIGEFASGKIQSLLKKVNKLNKINSLGCNFGPIDNMTAKLIGDKVIREYILSRMSKISTLKEQKEYHLRALKEIEQKIEKQKAKE